MGLVADIFIFLVKAFLSRQVAEEFRAWTPWLVKHLIQYATNRLPEDQKERFKEEWQSHADEIPGQIGKVLTSCGFVVSTWKMYPVSPRSTFVRQETKQPLFVFSVVVIGIPMLVTTTCMVASMVMHDATPMRLSVLSMARLTLALAGGSKTAAQDAHLQANMAQLQQMLSGLTPRQLNTLALLEWVWLLDILVGAGACFWYTLLQPILTSFKNITVLSHETHGP